MDDQLPLAPDGYALVSPIGRGASSVVWEARRLATGRPVGLKLLDADVSDPDAQRRFAREREAMTALARHRNILTILDAGVQDGRPWLAMELCRRGSLARHLSDGGPLDLASALRVLVRLADALAVAHDSGVVHCDIKPANVMLTDAGEPVLGDFGIARVSVGRATTTTVGGFSLDHVAPELLDNGKRSPLSDVYSLGTTTWELLVGHPPFRQSQDVSVGAVLTRILTRPLPESELIPPAVLALLRRMAGKSPDERPGSMREVVAEVRALAATLGIDPDGPALPAATPIEVATTTYVPQAVIDAEFAATGTHHRLVAVLPPPPTPRGTLRVGGRPVPAVAAALLLVVFIGGGTFGAYRLVGGWTAAPPAAAPAVQQLAAAEPVPTTVPTTEAVPTPEAAPPAPEAPRRAAPRPPAATRPRPSYPPPTTNPPPSDPEPDINGNGTVDCDDLRIVRANQDRRGSGIAADVDHNGVVNHWDTDLVKARLLYAGISCDPVTVTSSTAPVPVVETESEVPESTYQRRSSPLIVDPDSSSGN